MKDNLNHPISQRFASYPVWVTMRILTTLGNAMVVLWFGWAIVAFLALVNGGSLELLPYWVAIAGLILGGGSGSRYNESKQTLSLIAEIVGRRLAPRNCLRCGQSVFERSPSVGYISEADRFSYWPSKMCTNCGQDLTRQVHP